MRPIALDLVIGPGVVAFALGKLDSGNAFGGIDLEHGGDGIAEEAADGLEPVAFDRRFGDGREHDLDVLLAEQGNALVAMVGTETLDDAPALPAGVGGEVLPLLGTVVVDGECVDGAGRGTACTDLLGVFGDGRERHGIGGHELFGAGETGKRDRPLTVATEVVANTAAFASVVCKGVDVFESDVRHAPSSVVIATAAFADDVNVLELYAGHCRRPHPTRSASDRRRSAHRQRW